MVNEEANAGAGDFQSLTAELENAKKDGASVNEALAIVNRQLQGRLAELEGLNADLRSQLLSSDVASICLDRDLRLKWFSAAMRRAFNLVQADIGRPIGDLARLLSGGIPRQEIATVLKTEVATQKELRLGNGRWYIRRVLPFRSEERRVDGVVITLTDITESRLSVEGARAFSLALTMAGERERRLLAQDLHDDLGQVLAVAKLKLTALDESERRGHLRPLLQEIESLIDHANRAVRTLAFQLAPPALLAQGLIPALEWLADEIERTYGLVVHISDDGSLKPLDEPAMATMFRAVRELLTNVAKHSQTKYAEINCLCADGSLIVAVSDEGCGFDADAVLASGVGASGFGLAGMRERIALVGGDMQVDSSPGDGATITLIVPLRGDGQSGQES